ncbi:cell division protein FtsQ/DivIB [Ferrovibrio sp.]|uniref:cell division protein FtsQ/DivIB n=1 Tax=Ferrovibrio sp. TaxID=1917215 RepID=UPI00311F9111
MRSLIVLPEDRPCAPCAPTLPPPRPKGYCRPLPPARRKPRSVFWRRIRWGLLAVLLAGTIGGGTFAWFRTDLPAQARLALQQAMGEAGANVDLRVGEVNLRGRRHAPLEMLAAAVEVERGDPILSLDLDSLRRRLETIGWVRQATVWRQLPDTLHIEIEEREPFARWQIDGRVYLVDEDGRVLQEIDQADFAGLLLLVGAGASDKAHDLMAMLQTDPLLAGHVVAAIRLRGRRWDIQFDNGVVARLPEENPEAAWARLAALEKNEGLLRRDIVMVDLRLEDRLIVRLSPEAEAAAAANQAAPAKKTPGKRT